MTSSRRLPRTDTGDSGLSRAGRPSVDFRAVSLIDLCRSGRAFVPGPNWATGASRLLRTVVLRVTLVAGVAEEYGIKAPNQAVEGTEREKRKPASADER